MRLSGFIFFLFAVFCLLCEGQPLPDAVPELRPAESATPLPGTSLLQSRDDLSQMLVDGNDQFLTNQLKRQRVQRQDRWKRDSSGPLKYEASIEENRESLKEILGLHRDPAGGFYDSEKVGFTIQSNPGHEDFIVASSSESGGTVVRDVIWPVFDGIYGRGILLEPEAFHSNVIAIPDSSEWLGEITMGNTFPFALALAENGARVFIPSRITRKENQFTLTDREWLHRPAFVLGRTLIGYELHKLFALASSDTDPEQKPWRVVGWGDGGMLALYAGATNPIFQSVYVSGYFGSREELWKEPFDHHLFGLLAEFGDADIASLVPPRTLILEHSVAPIFHYRADSKTKTLDRQIEYTDRKGKPGFFRQQSSEEFEREWETLAAFFPGPWKPEIRKLTSGERPFTDPEIRSFLARPESTSLTGGDAKSRALSPATQLNSTSIKNRERHEIEAHLQRSLIESSRIRKERFKKLDTQSLKRFASTIEPFRREFANSVIGDFALELEAPEPRSRLIFESEKTKSYEITLQVCEELFAYGILTLPKPLPLDGSVKRPVVVCQHGLEGSPFDLIGDQKFKAYRAFATRLAEEGFITFSPQNGYKYFDHFRLQQFKAQSMGKTLFSLMIPKHRQITNWLAEQPYIDDQKIAFYGLSYGGKSAMRIPPLVDKYCLAICSGDFNEWVWKNAATDPESLRYSYANKGEYEIFEWNLGGTFNYAEMAALICPRPFMVERGHFDGVAPDEMVAHEFAKVRNLYAARLGIGDRCAIEWFAGPHRINGDGTVKFLKQHLGP